MAAGEPELTSGGRAAVLGSPIRHSLSPVLHRAAYAELGLDWTYEAIELDAAQVADFLHGLDRSWRGLSVTMPLKRPIMAFCQTLSATAVAVEAVNTVVLTAAGRAGHNTDVPGLVAALAAAGHDVVPTLGVLGGGATAAAVVAAGARLGSVTRVAVRSAGRREELLAVAARTGTDVVVEPWSAVPDVMASDVVVSTVPVAASDALAARVPTDVGVLFDVVYDPWPTPLARAWPQRAGVIGGLELLVHQAVDQVELMTGRRPSWEPMREAGLAALSER